jgi:hypothetical protein
LYMLGNIAIGVEMFLQVINKYKGGIWNRS